MKQPKAHITLENLTIELAARGNRIFELEKEVLALKARVDPPPPYNLDQTMGIVLGTRWQHSNGVYVPYDFTNLGSNEEMKYPPRVSYRGENGKVWSRSISDWHRSMKEIE